MATKKKNTSSGRRNTTAKRSTARSASSAKKSSGKNRKKEGQGPDLITVIVVLVAVVLVLVLISKYKDDKKGNDGGKAKGTPSVTGTSSPGTPTPDGQNTPVPSQSATKAPVATATPVPTPTEVPVLSQDEALRIANAIIELEKYSIELLDDHLIIDGVEYFVFCVSNEKGEELSPTLIVDRKTGTLLCFDLSDGVAPIAKFPPDKTESGNNGQDILTVEEAKAMLAGYTAERLGLAKAPSAYEMTADDWTTMADGVECYGINFFEESGGKQRFRGTFYVALDGSAVYGKDDVTGEFIKR